MLHDTRETMIGMSKTEKIIMYVVFSAGGMIAGYFFTRIINWLMELEWFTKWVADPIKFEFIMKLIEKIQGFTGDWSNIILSVFGFLCGLFLVHWMIEKSILMTITDTAVNVKKGSLNIEIPRKDIQHVFLDNGEIVILDFSGHELFREPHDSSKGKVERAFKNHHYPWKNEGDPYKDHYFLWSEDSPDLSIPESALLKARETAIEHDDEKEMKDLKRELAKLNIVVRDEDGFQYWRKV